MEGNQDQDKMQNTSFSHSDNEDTFEKIYGVKSRDASENNSKDSLTLGATYQSNMFSTPEKYSNIHFFCRHCCSVPNLDFKSVLNIISRDSYIEYFSKKMRIILEDELFNSIIITPSRIFDVIPGLFFFIIISKPLLPLKISIYLLIALVLKELKFNFFNQLKELNI